MNKPNDIQQPLCGSEDPEQQQQQQRHDVDKVVAPRAALGRCPDREHLSFFLPWQNAATHSRPTHALTAFTHDGAATIGLVFVALFAASCFLLIRSPADICWEDAAGPEYVLPRFSKHYRAFLGVRIATQEV